jgi:hypothetical protein
MPWPAEAGGQPERRLRALLSCETVSDELPFVVDGSRRPSAAMEGHLHNCLSCQAELVGYRRLLRALRALRDQAAPGAVPELLGATLSALHEHPSWPARRGPRPWAVAGAVAAAGVAALSAGALVARAKQGRAMPAIGRSALG